MFQVLGLYVITSIIFLGLDFMGIKFLIRPLFDRHVPQLLAAELRLGAAAAFYLFYVAGLLWLISLPALKEGQPLQALIGGMILGALCYGTYEMTNYATLAGWSIEQVAADMLWGTLLTGFSAWAGVAVLSGKLA